MTTAAFWKAREPKRLHWIEGASHVDLYDKDEYVTPAVANLAEHFEAILGGTRSDHRHKDRVRKSVRSRARRGRRALRAGSSRRCSLRPAR